MPTTSRLAMALGSTRAWFAQRRELWVRLVRLIVIAVLLGELWLVAMVQLPGLLHPTAIGTDASNYYAAGQRLDAGHNLYGPLLPGDRPVPGYPERFPAPILSPPLVAVIWRPLAALGPVSMTIWWAGGLVVAMGIALAFAAVARGWRSVLLVALVSLGLPLTLITFRRYLYPGYDSPVAVGALSGNLNTYLTGIFVVAWWAMSRGRRTLAGVAIGAATVLKLGPVALIWWLAVRREWTALRACLVTAAVLLLVGLIGAGWDANVAFARLAIGAGVEPTRWSIPGLLRLWLHLDPHLANLGSLLAIAIGLVAVYAWRRNARLAFLAAILVEIYSSPVVLQGNLIVLLAAAAPWVIQGVDGRRPSRVIPDASAPRPEGPPVSPGPVAIAQG